MYNLLLLYVEIQLEWWISSNGLKKVIAIIITEVIKLLYLYLTLVSCKPFRIMLKRMEMLKEIIESLR